MSLIPIYILLAPSTCIANTPNSPHFNYVCPQIKRGMLQIKAGMHYSKVPSRSPPRPEPGFCFYPRVKCNPIKHIHGLEARNIYFSSLTVFPFLSSLPVSLSPPSFHSLLRPICYIPSAAQHRRSKLKKKFSFRVCQ